jgi:heme-degrading monooxygenase HmoA
MHIVVVNRITLSVPVEEVVVGIEREVPSIFAGLEGFVGQTLVKTGPQELVVVGRWASPEAAAAGAAVVGPARSTPGSRPAPRDRTAWWDGW